MASLDSTKTAAFVAQKWDESVVRTITEYIKIPNMSPMFDPEWATNGHMENALKLLIDWANEQKTPGFKLEVVREAGRTPLVFIDIDGTSGNTTDTVILYGHMDKQPPLTDAWDEGLGPYTPVIKDGKLYGRGGADDGYALFSALTAINAIKAQGLAHSRCIILIEACEESGSFDLPFYMTKLADRFGEPSLIICLDSGCGTYDRFWLTSSLRGLVAGTLKVQILSEAVHSGAASGVVPSSFRIMRQLLSRIEDENTGRVLVPECGIEISDEIKQQAKATAAILGDTIFSEVPFVAGAKPMNDDLAELLLNKAWRPTVSYTGVEGMPSIAVAGNVLRTHTELMLSVRIPPKVDAAAAGAALKAVLEKDPPYGAHVSFEVKKSASGWSAPSLAPWLADSLKQAAHLSFENKDHAFIGEGGSIPFMGLLGAQFPKAQFLITGVLGPKSNAHGPNEFLDIEMSRRVTTCVAFVLREHAKINHGK